MKPEGAAQRERNNMGKISYWADVAESSHDRLRQKLRGKKRHTGSSLMLMSTDSMSKLSA